MNYHLNPSKILCPLLLIVTVFVLSEITNNWEFVDVSNTGITKAHCVNHWDTDQCGGVYEIEDGKFNYPYHSGFIGIARNGSTVYMYGGNQGNYDTSRNVWKFENRNWTFLWGDAFDGKDVRKNTYGGNPKPSGKIGSKPCFMESRSALYMFGGEITRAAKRFHGDLWSYDLNWDGSGTPWTFHSPFADQSSSWLNDFELSILYPSATRMFPWYQHIANYSDSVHGYPGARNNHPVFCFNNSIYIWGGHGFTGDRLSNDDNRVIGDFWHWNVDDERWYLIEEDPNQRTYRFVSSFVEPKYPGASEQSIGWFIDEIFFLYHSGLAVTGDTSGGNVWFYDLNTREWDYFGSPDNYGGISTTYEGEQMLRVRKLPLMMGIDKTTAFLFGGYEDYGGNNEEFFGDTWVLYFDFENRDTYKTYWIEQSDIQKTTGYFSHFDENDERCDYPGSRSSGLVFLEDDVIYMGLGMKDYYVYFYQDLWTMNADFLTKNDTVCITDSVHCNEERYSGCYFPRIEKCECNSESFSGEDCEICADQDFYPPNCNVTTCFGYFSNETYHVCGGEVYGTCVSKDSCLCIHNQSDPLTCQMFYCNGTSSWNDSIVCSGQGKCVSNGTCECDAFLDESSFCSVFSLGDDVGWEMEVIADDYPPDFYANNIIHGSVAKYGKLYILESKDYDTPRFFIWKYEKSNNWTLLFSTQDAEQLSPRITEPYRPGYMREIQEGMCYVEDFDSLFIFGGRGLCYDCGFHSYLSSIWQLNASNDSWIDPYETCPYQDLGASNALGVYDIENQGVEFVNELPGGRKRGLAFCTTNKYYIFGGYGMGATSSMINLADLWEFSPDTGRWRWLRQDDLQYDEVTIPNTMTPPYYPSNLGSDGKGRGWNTNKYLFLFHTVDQRVWKYDIELNEWNYFDKALENDRSYTESSLNIGDSNPLSISTLSDNLAILMGGGSNTDDIWVIQYDPIRMSIDFDFFDFASVSDDNPLIWIPIYGNYRYGDMLDTEIGEYTFVWLENSAPFSNDKIFTLDLSFLLDCRLFLRYLDKIHVEESCLNDDNDAVEVLTGCYDVPLQQCECLEGYSDQNCSTTTCSGISSEDTENACGGLETTGQRCWPLDTCSCEKYRYDFTVCNQTTCGDYVNGDELVCSGHGICFENGKCLCENGYGYNKTSLLECVSCETGEYGENGECYKCDNGTYQSSLAAIGSSSCIQCGIGLYSTELNKQCLPCPAGTFSDFPGTHLVSGCSNCGKGKWSSQLGLASEEGCLSCPLGTYQSTLVAYSQDFCIPCPSGTWNDILNSEDQSDCSPCGTGRYSDQTGLVNETGCILCPTGSFGPLEVASSVSHCDLCEPGTYNGISGSTNSSDCVPCGVGRYGTSQGAHSESLCSSCPVGTFGSQEVANSLVACELCPAGHFNDREGRSSILNCLPCHSGYYNDLLGQEECLACPPGSYSFNNTCVLCFPGTYSTKSAATSSTTCSNCPSGTFSNVSGSEFCSPCPSGSYQEVGGQSSCIDCTEGGSSSLCPLGSSRVFLASSTIEENEHHEFVTEVFSLKYYYKLMILFLFFLVVCVFVLIILICSKIRGIKRCVQFTIFDCYFHTNYHDINDGESVMKRKTGIGGVCSLIAFAIAASFITFSMIDFFFANKISNKYVDFYFAESSSQTDFYGNFLFRVDVIGTFDACEAVLNLTGIVPVNEDSPEIRQSSGRLDNDAGSCRFEYECNDCTIGDLHSMRMNFEIQNELKYISLVNYYLILPGYFEEEFEISGRVFESDQSIKECEVFLSLFPAKKTKISGWNLLFQFINVEFNSNSTGLGGSIQSTNVIGEELVTENSIQVIFSMIFSNLLFVVEEQHSQTVLSFIAQVTALFSLAIALIGWFFEKYEKCYFCCCIPWKDKVRGRVMAKKQLETRIRRKSSRKTVLYDKSVIKSLDKEIDKELGINQSSGSESESDDDEKRNVGLDHKKEMKVEPFKRTVLYSKKDDIELKEGEKEKSFIFLSVNEKVEKDMKKDVMKKEKNSKKEKKIF